MRDDKTKTVVYTATREMYENLAICVRSLLKNGNVDEVYLVLENYDKKLMALCPGKVVVICARDQLIFPEYGVNYHSRWTYMALMKAAMHRLPDFKDKDRVLVLDCDTLVEEDLSPLWKMDLTDYYFAMVRQRSDGRNGDFSADAPYFNTGVMMCNLDELRDGKGDEIINRLNTHYYEYPEQDCINKLCRGKIKELPGRYNYCEFNIQDSKCIIRHYAANKNWTNTAQARAYEE